MADMRNLFMNICLIVGCLLATATPAMAQRLVTGTVTDNGKAPLPGATVSVKERQAIGTTADGKGHFRLKLPDDEQVYTLQVSYVGYETRTRKVKPGEKGTMNFTLQENAVDMETVVVTGTRTPKLLKDTPIATRVFTAEEIEKVDVTDARELLQSELPGFEISYTMSQQAALNLSGFGGNAVLFLVDGERLAGETLDNVDYSRLNLDNVERIEIVKGAASSLYGSNAVGGVVNMISKTSDEPWQVSLTGHYGSHDEQRHGGTVGFNLGRFNSVTNVQYTHVNTVDLQNEDTENAAYNALYGNKTWNFKERLVYTATDRLKLTARAGYFFRERDSSAELPDRYRDFSGGLRGNYTFSRHNDLEVAYTFDQYDKSTYVRSSGYDVRDYSNVQNSFRALYNHTFLENYTLTAGGDYMHDYLMSYQFTAGGSKEQSIADGFAQMDMNFGQHINVIAGLRYDYYSDANVSHISSKLGFMYKVGNCSLRASYAGGFRTPTLKERYMNFDMGSIFMIYGSEGLKAEKSHNLMVTAEYMRSRYNLTVSGFYNIVDNRITTVWNQTLEGLGDNRGGMQYTNLSRVLVGGVDANASVRYPCGLGARLSYTYTHEHFGGDDVVARSTRPHTATARIEYDKRLHRNYAFNVALSGRFLSKVNAEEIASSDGGAYDHLETMRYEGYTIWKLTLSQKIWKGINLTLAADNLFNYKPSTYYSNSCYTTGTTFSATLSLDVDKLCKR